MPFPLVLLAALVLARLALAEWWLIADDGVVDVESGRHLMMAWNAYVAMSGGDELVLLRSATEYPPLHHGLGIAGAAIGGLDVESFVAAQDLLCIPALAIGCYGAGSIAYGRTAGLLAAVFALGTPMALSVFHMYLIDTPEAAMVALSVWAILASERFSRTGVAALAGVAVGFGMLAKQNFPIFVVGLGLVVLLRGGWRHWRGLLMFAAVAALISATWYWSEIDRTLELIRGASASAAAPEAASAATPSRWTAQNFGWYLWSTVNMSVYLPLTLLTAAGIVSLGVRWTRTRARDDYTPELIAGGIASYLALSWIALKDPRYALPALPYMAVLGTGWMVTLRLPWRRVAIGALCTIALGNTIAAIGGTGRTVAFTIPGATPSGLGEGQFTLAKAGGWIAGPPETEGAVLKTMLAAKAGGATGIAFDPGAAQSNFNHPGLDIMSRVAEIPLADPYDLQNPRHVLISSRPPVPPGPAPCAVSSRGMGVYLSTGLVEIPFEDRQFVCRRDGSVRLPARTLDTAGGR
jgi:4-amino-4-deoxy-L-arabinose transferase-like glycosyltransferase